MSVTQIGDHDYLVDGVRRVGPSVVYATVPVSLVARAQNFVLADKASFTAAELLAIANEALHCAASALDIGDPRRSMVVQILNEMRT